MKTIIFDVDGVLADFSRSFTLIGSALFDTPVVGDMTHDHWDFRKELSTKQRERIWADVKGLREWWTTLAPLVEPEVFRRIEFLTAHHEVYFVTNRFSNMRPAGEQTITWLKIHGIADPRVIVSSRKGEIASALKATHALEDNWQNASVIHWMASGCRTFLIERHYNEEARKMIPEGITVVKTVEEFLGYVEKEEV